MTDPNFRPFVRAVQGTDQLV